MKNSFLFFAFLLPAMGFSQDNEGVVRYLITHNWTKKMASLDYISKQQKEKMSYIWGSRLERKMYANFYFNAVESKYEDSEEKAEPDDNTYSWKKEVFFVQRNYEKNTLSDAMTIQGKLYLIEDTITKPNWKILNDMKEVAGHVCMNATWYDSLKMQAVTAWFALDMPINGGPERFCGLPGLILEVDVNNGAMVVSADKIDVKKLDKQLEPSKKLKAKKINEAGYEEILVKRFEEARKNEEPPFWGMRY